MLCCVFGCAGDVLCESQVYVVVDRREMRKTAKIESFLCGYKATHDAFKYIKLDSG